VRTNIVIDENLIQRAKKLTGLTTKRAIVEEALKTLIRTREQESVLKLRGKVRWEGDLSEMRQGRFVDADHR
jgi:Arc/MetJ family transcription regulator